MTVVPATVADIPAIRAVAMATWPQAYGSILSPAQLTYMLDRIYSEEALEVQLTTQMHRALLLERGEEVVGFASFQHEADTRDQTRLHKLYVLPALQGLGGGVLLMQAVEAAARSRGSSSLVLNVNRFNRAKEFYLKQGFRQIRDEVIDIGSGFVMDDHVMELDLSSST